MKEELPRIVASHLQLGDTVELCDTVAQYMTATVYKIDDGKIYLRRPYVITSDFATTMGVIPYVGLETVVLSTQDTRMVILHSRKNIV